MISTSVLCRSASNVVQYQQSQICNNIQLNRILPPGPREYWSELAAEHKKAEPHLQWMYDQDPFRARRQVQERQTQAAARKEKASNEPKVAKEFIHAPEVKMGSQLRTMVEDVIGQVRSTGISVPNRDLFDY
jgi:ATP-dependent RNA helicase DHX57